MYHTLNEFLEEYKHESQSTLKLLKVLTDESLYLSVDGKVRSIGRLVYHIGHTMPEMLGKLGFEIPFPVNNPAEDDSVTAGQLADAYAAAVDHTLNIIPVTRTDSVLPEKRNMYGEEWTVEYALSVFLKHEIHHRGQLTVLMRLAGLPVIGVYGPAAEEWVQYGLTPEV